MEQAIIDLLLSDNKEDNKLGLILANKTCGDPVKDVYNYAIKPFYKHGGEFGDKHWELVAYYYNYEMSEDDTCYNYKYLKTPEEL